MNPFSTADEVKTFMFAGNAYVTLKSLASDVHYTYRVNKPDDGKVYFVSLLTQGDVYVYVGMIDPKDLFKGLILTKKSTMRDTSPPYRAFNWFLGNIVERNTIPPKLEVRHEGRCGKCGRQLTTPQSIDRGIGPTCARAMGLQCDEGEEE